MYKFAVIGGVEAYRLLNDGLLVHTELGIRETPFGTSAPIFKIEAEGLTFLFMSRHGSTQYLINSSTINYRANLYALKDLGVDSIISWTGCGSLTEGFPTASLAILEDVIDETRNRVRTFFPKSSLGFLRQNPLFCSRLKKIMSDSIHDQNLNLRHGGVYVCTEGPRLDTVAEVRKYQFFGGELVGNTLVPEVFLARELELCYAAFAIVMNRAEGTIRRGYDPSEPFGGIVGPDERQALEQLFKSLPSLLSGMTQQLNAGDMSAPQAPCACQRLLEHHRANGHIDHNWRTYITQETDCH